MQRIVYFIVTLSVTTLGDIILNVVAPSGFLSLSNVPQLLVSEFVLTLTHNLHNLFKKYWLIFFVMLNKQGPYSQHFIFHSLLMGSLS